MRIPDCQPEAIAKAITSGKAVMSVDKRVLL